MFNAFVAAGLDGLMKLKLNKWTIGLYNRWGLGLWNVGWEFFYFPENKPFRFWCFKCLCSPKSKIISDKGPPQQISTSVPLHTTRGWVLPHSYYVVFSGQYDEMKWPQRFRVARCFHQRALMLMSLMWLQLKPKILKNILNVFLCVESETPFSVMHAAEGRHDSKRERVTKTQME